MSTPRTIDQYLRQLRDALRGADAALIQDALYDAEEHLRAELAEQPERNEADMLAQVVGSYGAPDEVAEIYRDQEVKVQRALRAPSSPVHRSFTGRFFGVAADPRTWGALFYLVLTLATGLFYFSWAAAGISLSVGLSLLIIGLPFIVLFIGSTRALSLLEGRIVETMLGVRMPRRPPYPSQEKTVKKRIGAMFTDVRTWTTLIYMLLMLPLGIIYFGIVVGLLGLASFLMAMPIATTFFYPWLADIYVNHVVLLDWGFGPHVPSFGELAVMFVIGVLLIFATLHLARALGRLHVRIARPLLVSGTAR